MYILYSYLKFIKVLHFSTKYKIPQYHFKVYGTEFKYRNKC